MKRIKQLLNSKGACHRMALFSLMDLETDILPLVYDIKN